VLTRLSELMDDNDLAPFVLDLFGSAEEVSSAVAADYEPNDVQRLASIAQRYQLKAHESPEQGNQSDYPPIVNKKKFGS